MNIDSDNQKTCPQNGTPTMPAMERFFNTAGPTKPDLHYQLDPLQRLDWDEVRHLIDTQRYFVLHAPRQTGKTTTLLAMMKALNAGGRYACAYANIEGAQATRGDVGQDLPLVCKVVAQAIDDACPGAELLHWYENTGADVSALGQFADLLSYWTRHCAKPVVLLLDGVDTLVGDSLISLLRQIRSRYEQRPHAFPQSIVLCGQRDIRDYRMYHGDTAVMAGSSVFNIKAASLRLPNFTQQEIQALWQQHTEATGQVFDEAIFPAL
ncbi:ATP-binding protein [Comamonas nitrativorans]|uniref:ATP-binding protein n=1 Tax=Comamonas nitrativorans TaxID=108437 RepID=A0ABV9GYS8_9BURK